jgi:ketosteroid isomerase-like protein
MVPSPAERNALFKAFARALFARDLDALDETIAPDFVWNYHDGETVVKSLVGRAAIAEHLAGQTLLYSEQRFHDVGYHHLPDRTFMTCDIVETERVSGAQRKQRCVELYTFKHGRIATKDVYRKRDDQI